MADEMIDEKETVMPEIYTNAAMAALFPKIHVFYRAPDNEIISPNKLKRMKLKYFKSGVAQVRPRLVVKRGSGVTLLEAKTMLYLQEHFSVSVTTVYAVCAHGHHAHWSGDREYDIYIFMEEVSGQDLDTCLFTLQVRRCLKLWIS